MSVEIDVAVLYRATAAAVYYKTYRGITREQMAEILKSKQIIGAEVIRKNIVKEGKWARKNTSAGSEQ